MWIVSGRKDEIIDSTFVQRFRIVVKPDAALVIASYNADTAVTISKYKNEREAKVALAELLAALAGGQNLFYMPESTLFYEQATTHDARTARKGGS